MQYVTCLSLSLSVRRKERDETYAEARLSEIRLPQQLPPQPIVMAALWPGWRGFKSPDDFIVVFIDYSSKTGWWSPSGRTTSHRAMTMDATRIPSPYEDASWHHEVWGTPAGSSSGPHLLHHSPRPLSTTIVRFIFGHRNTHRQSRVERRGPDDGRSQRDLCCQLFNDSILSSSSQVFWYLKAIWAAYITGWKRTRRGMKHPPMDGCMNELICQQKHRYPIQKNDLQNIRPFRMQILKERPKPESSHKASFFWHRPLAAMAGKDIWVVSLLRSLF